MNREQIEQELINQYSNIRPLKDNILMVWVDEYAPEHKRESGIILARTLTRTAQRWGLCVASGPKSNVLVGTYVLPKLCSDLLCSKYGDRYLWKTTDDNVTVVSDEFNDTEHYQNPIMA